MQRWYIAITIAIILHLGWAAAGGRFPWPRRIGRDVDSLHITEHKNTPVALWPDEPASPAPLDEARFASAFEVLCSDKGTPRGDELVPPLLGAASHFSIDPFLLAAIVYDGSECRVGTTQWDASRGLFGPARLPLEMHRPQIQKGVYRYFTGRPGAFAEHSLNVSEYPFKEGTLRNAASNLYFAAAVLAVFKAQHEDLDQAFESIAHRHFVSHYFFGDRVLGLEPENRVLTARRRLVSYYLGTAPDRIVGRYRDVSIASPLDGTPRLLLDYFGNPRGNSKGMGHRGIDMDAMEGEPVRAIADGVITFSGVDEPGGAKHRQLTLAEAAALSESDIGPGGFFVSVNHGNDFGTIYMHLSAPAVVYGNDVKRGDIIGYAGKSGAKKSGPHLHLEFRVGKDRADPAAPLAPVLVNPYANSPHF